MSGSVIGAIVLWLIVAIIVIAVVVYLVNWLYRRSTKEVSFVRTGLGGEKVVIDGGAFVVPIIHETTPVNMNVVQLEVVRDKENALITKDRMRVDMVAEFYVRVAPTREAVSMAAATVGRRTMEQVRLHELLSGKFIGALRSVGAEMTLEEMHERRGDYVVKVKEAASEALAMNGLELESVAITELDQTDLEYFNPSNRFDAEGLTRLIEEIETRRKTRNDIEQDAMVRIRARNLEAEKQTLEIERESETARLEQERDIEVRRAAQRADLARERAQRETEAEQAEISPGKRPRRRASRTRRRSVRPASRPSRPRASATSTVPAPSRRRRSAPARKSRRPGLRRSARSPRPASRGGGDPEAGDRTQARGGRGGNRGAAGDRAGPASRKSAR